MPTYAPELALVRGDGARVWDADWNEYLDILHTVWATAKDKQELYAEMGLQPEPSRSWARGCSCLSLWQMLHAFFTAATTRCLRSGNKVAIAFTMHAIIVSRPGLCFE